MNYVYGQPGNFGVSGTPLSDWIFANSDNLLFDGGPGKDVFAFGGDSNEKYILDFQDGSDLIDLSAYGVTSFDQLQIGYYEYGGKAIIAITGGPTIYVENVNDGSLPTMDPTDFIFAGTPIYTYSSGFDSVTISQNTYAIHLGNGGSNWLNLKSLVRGSATATEGALVVMDDDALGNGTFTVSGVTQHFFDFANIRGTGGKDTISGDQQDNHFAGLSNADVLYGGGGNDRLFGNSGTDQLHGDEGDDVLNGGTGRDYLWGGAGADSFVFVAYDNRKDLVYDYEDGIDSLDISQWGATSVDDLEIRDLGGGRVQVQMIGTAYAFELRAEDGSLTAADLDNGDFVFV